jgi:hypothetical protein
MSHARKMRAAGKYRQNHDYSTVLSSSRRATSEPNCRKDLQMVGLTPFAAVVDRRQITYLEKQES